MTSETHKIGLLGLFLLATTVLCVGCGSKSSDITARILKATGKVEIKQPTAASFTEAKENDILACGGILKTGDEASAMLEIIDKGVVELKSDALFELEPDKDYVVQKSGMAIYKIEKNKEGFKVKSPQGVTCVLGTKFMVRVLENMTVTGVDEGKVSFTANNGVVKDLIARQKIIADNSGFIGELLDFDLSSDAFNYLQIEGKWVPKEAVEK